MMNVIEIRIFIVNHTGNAIKKPHEKGLFIDVAYSKRLNFLRNGTHHFIRIILFVSL